MNTHRVPLARLCIKRSCWILLAALTIGFYSLNAQTATVTVDTSRPFMVSPMEIGLTHTGQDWIWSNDETGKASMKQLLVDGGVRFQNIHIMGWGAGNPNPSPGVYDWKSLDMRIEEMRGMNAELILTLCTAPGWMKPSGDDWTMNDPVLPEHYEDFATLCVEAARRYPDIQYFQIWNELKGWWMGGIEEFTVFYNTVYDALRAERPNAIIAGPYMNGLSDDLKQNGTMLQETHDAFDHFLANTNGADIVNYDGWLTGYPASDSTLNEAQLMANTACFGNITATIRTKTNKPIWISEFYAAQPENSSNEAFLVANHASAYYHALIQGTQLSLKWDAFSHVGMFHDLGNAEGTGGTARPHYDVIAAFNNHFGPGTQLYTTTCSASDIEVLASAEKTLLINKANQAHSVTVNETPFDLIAYEVKVVDTPVAQPESAPNILLIMVDDMNEDTVGAVIGGKAVTPRIQALKSEGITFERAHVNVAVCQPSRQILMTGKHPHQIGALGFTPIDESVTTFGEILSNNGYYNGIFCKEHHLAPEHKYAWDVVGGTNEMHQGRSVEEFYNRTLAFIQEAQTNQQPFFLMANSEDPHRPLHGTQDEQNKFGDILHNFSVPSAVFTADDVDTLMPWVDHLPFNANARLKNEEDLAAYYSSCRRADDSVARILDALDETGEADNTIVVFMSDNGMAFPGGKWQNYQAATRTPFIVRWPAGGIVGGTVNSEDFISNIDFLPTMLEAIGLESEIPGDIAGASYFDLLTGSTDPARESLVTAHYSSTTGKPLSQDDIDKGFSLPPVGSPINETHIRCYQDGEFSYIYNHWSDQIKTYLLGGENGMGNFVRNTSEPEIKAYRDFMYYRVPEEFYDLVNDPHSQNNLIDDPTHQAKIAEFRSNLRDWMVQESDEQLADFDAYLASLVNAPVEPVRGDAPNLILNGDFEVSTEGQGQVPSDWLMSGETDHVNLIWTEDVSGNQMLMLHKERTNSSTFDSAYQVKMYNNSTDDFKAKVYQGITGLSRGTYALKAKVRKEGALYKRAHLTVFGDNNEEYSVVIPSAQDMQTIFIRDIQIDDGQASIGIDTEAFAAMWAEAAVYVDDIEFFEQQSHLNPVFSEDPIVMRNVNVGALYYESINWKAEDPEGTALTFERVSGPAWLNVSENGILSGTPAVQDLGESEWIVRVTDAQGGSATARVQLRVTPELPDYGLSAGEAVIDLAQPNGPSIYRASGMLWGLSGIEPSDSILDPLKFQVFRSRLTPWVAESGIGSMQRMQDKGARIQAVISDEYNLDPRSRGRLEMNGEQLYTNPNDHDDVAGFGYQHIEVWPGDIVPETEVAALLPANLSNEYRITIEGVPHIDMTFIWDEVVDDCLQRVEDAGLEVEWDIWEEPGNSAWFAPFDTSNDPDKVARDANWERYYETHVHTYHRIKAHDPDARFVGPSAYRYDWPNGQFIKNFLLYTRDNGALPDSVAWHELMDNYNSNPADVVEHMDDMRSFLVANNIDVHAFDMNEIVSDGRDSNSAMYLWYIAELEKAYVTTSCRAVWREDDAENTFNGWLNMLGGMLTRDLEPRSNYWIHTQYTEIEGTLFNVVEDAKILSGLAGTNTAGDRLTVLLSQIDYNGASATTHSLKIKTSDGVLPWLKDGHTVSVTATRLPNSTLDASAGPVAYTLAQDQYTISGGEFTIQLGGDAEGFTEHDALQLSIEPVSGPPPSSGAYTVQIDLENRSADPTTGGFWNVIDSPSGDTSLDKADAEASPLYIGSWSDSFSGGNADEATSFDFASTVWGDAAQDYFDCGGGGDFRISGFSPSDVVEFQILAVENNRRDIDFQINGEFGDGTSPENGDNYRTRQDGWQGGVHMTWSGLTGSDSYLITLTPTDGDVPVISAIRVNVNVGAVFVDSDGDGLSDADELLYGTLVDDPDTDDDGLSDGREVNELGTDPNKQRSSAEQMHDLLFYSLDAGSFSSERLSLPTLVSSGDAFEFTIPKTEADDVDYSVEVSLDLMTWYRVTHKLAGGSWEKDSTDDATPVYVDIDKVSVIPNATGVTVSEQQTNTARYYRARVEYE
ncbi:MAG: sulfatase-like hydrolase/transferase [Opitutales bacterium]